MLYKNKVCNKCGRKVDEAYDCCPNCLEDFSLDSPIKYSNKLLWLPLTYQLGLFLIGWAGFQLICLLVGLILISLSSTNEMLYKNLVNFLGYLILLIILVVLIFLTKQNRYIKTFFNQYKVYLKGILAGVVVIVVTMLYSMIVSAFYKGGVNENETLVRSMINTYPVMSFFMVVLFGPICEEITYRLGLFTFLSRINRYLAYILTAVIFGLIHFDFFAPDLVNELVNLPSYIMCGLIFCFSYEQFGIAGSITTHMVNNLFSFIMVLIAANG